MYDQFISTLKSHQANLLSQEEMNDIIEGILRPYPEIAQNYKKFNQGHVSFEQQYQYRPDMMGGQ